MKKYVAMIFLSACLPQAVSALDTPRIEKITGLKGKLDEKAGVFKVTSPRSDVAVSVDGRKLDPFLGLTSWAAFTTGEKAATMVMGDLMLFQDEVNPAMSAALENGLTVTALHNHFFYDEPKVYFMHIGGEGETEKLAAGVRAAFDAVRKVRSANAMPAEGFFGADLPAENTITPKPLQDLLGLEGTAKDGMFKISIGRDVEMDCGCKVGGAMGVASWAAFGGSDVVASVDGDFAVTAAELQPTLKSLRSNGINIVAIHNHMTAEKPQIIFFHYWGKGKASELAKAIKTALKIAHPN